LHQPHKKQLTAEDIEVRVWGFVVVAVTLILCFIVVALLYSVTFVTQPIKSMAPIDMAYTKMLNDIVLLIVGGIGGVIGKKGVGAVAQTLAGTPPPQQYMQVPVPSGYQPPYANPYQPQTVANVANNLSQGMNWMGFKNPDLDESWTPPPPPTTPPDHMEPDHEREQLALARKEVD
jgi:hypothetical protein